MKWWTVCNVSEILYYLLEEKKKRVVPKGERKVCLDPILLDVTKVIISKHSHLYKVITAREATWIHNVNISSKSSSIFEGPRHSNYCYVVKGLFYGLGLTRDSKLLLKLVITLKSLWNFVLSQNMNKILYYHKIWVKICILYSWKCAIWFVLNSAVFIQMYSGFGHWKK